MKRAIVILALLLTLAAGAAAAGRLARDIGGQTAQSVKQAVLDAAVQCCAIEGAYPPNLDYLKENYGLAISGDYIVDYEIFASNILPEVTVIGK